MQEDARNKALAGSVSGLISAASMEYAQKLLLGTASATSFTSVGSYTVGDFSGTISAGTTGLYEAQITGAPTGYTTALTTTYAKKQFRLY